MAAKKFDKVILTNWRALVSKYRPAGAAKIRKAVDELISADARRGLSVVLVAVDDASAMQTYGGHAVTNASDCRQNKAAVDAVYKDVGADYLMILGATDVIPHQDLDNPLHGGDDVDTSALGDLPYACEHAYSTKPDDFLGATRVVGRLPDITGGNDPSYLVDLLKVAASYKPRPAKSFMNDFGVTAEVWKKSSQLSVQKTFGPNGTLTAVPPHGANWPSSQTRRLTHFINCHGAYESPEFFGQPANGSNSYPVALKSKDVDGAIGLGTVMAAECCYGGQLYDPIKAQVDRPIVNAYLANKAYAVFASTTIAYGPADRNAQADIICQYFLQSVLKGASIGRAALEARQKFVRTESPLDPGELKTVAQFNLYGDPSIVPVTADATAVPAAAKAIGAKRGGKEAHDWRAASDRAARQNRRRVLFRQGADLALHEPGLRPAKPPTKAVAAEMRAQALASGFKNGKIRSFKVEHRATVASTALPKALMREVTTPTFYRVLTAPSVKMKGRSMRRKDGVAAPPDITLLIGKEVDGRIVSFVTVHSR